MDKDLLDTILETHKAQPVGHGYIDIIVSRENFKRFIKSLIMNGYSIKSVSWWEWCPEGKECDYGLGGPQSNFYNGYFAELPVNIDDIEISADLSNEKVIEHIINLIEEKSITYPDERVTFKQNNWLTPAIWLDVPSSWRNNYSA